MYNLDFLSAPPQISFLRKDTNQTFFGGCLFIIYMIIMVGISAIYVLNYVFNEKYDVTYSLIKNTEVNEEEIKKDENELNPVLEFSFDLLNLNLEGNETLSDNFFLMDLITRQIIERKTILKRRPTEIMIGVGYKCNDPNCTLDENDKTDMSYFFHVNYTGFKIDHQSNNIPLEANNPNYVFDEDYPFLFGQTTIGVINWEVIKYKEERGILGLFDSIFGIKSEYTSGFFESYRNVNSEKAKDIYNDQNVLTGKLLGMFLVMNEHKQYIEYKREKVSVLDVVANIGALFSTVFACFLFGFQFYSKNYDNYKIIESVLSIKQPKTNKKTTYIELGDQINDPNYKKEEDKNDAGNEPLIINDSPTDINEDEKTDKEKESSIQKLSFKHFFLNSFYSECFKFQKEHKVLEICGDVLAKYSSIELLLYNQILFENLIKDYKWNNPELRNVENNELLFKLKNIG